MHTTCKKVKEQELMFSITGQRTELPGKLSSASPDRIKGAVPVLYVSVHLPIIST